MLIGKLERHDHPFPGAGTLLKERPGTFLGAATQALQARRSGVSEGILHHPRLPAIAHAMLGASIRVRATDHSPTHLKNSALLLRSLGVGLLSVRLGWWNHFFGEPP